MSHDPFDHEFERGMQQRRSVLGDTWVDRSVANATNFNAEFQNLITRFAWHEIWGRPGLDHKTRRVIVLAITLALGRWEEFELHVRAALLANDATRLTPDEMKEVLMQSAIYAGVPAANTAFAHAQQILREVAEQIGYILAPTAPAASFHSGDGRSGLSTRGKEAPARARLHYSIRPPRNGKAPRHTIILSHALGCDLTMWDSLVDSLVDSLTADCQVIAFDHRGHGSSDSPEGLYSMADLADDAAQMLRDIDSGPVVWVGLSLGGMVGQELALRHPQLVRALVLANTTSAYPAAAQQVWRERIETVREEGIEAIADAVMGRYFHVQFRATEAATVARFRARLTSTDALAYIGCCNAVGSVDTTARLGQIKAPTLVIAGELDQGTPVAMSQVLAAGIADARLEVISEASHLSAVEQPQKFAALLTGFLAGL